MPIYFSTSGEPSNPRMVGSHVFYVINAKNTEVTIILFTPAAANLLKAVGMLGSVYSIEPTSIS